MTGIDSHRRGWLAVTASLWFAGVAAAQPPIYYNGPQPPQPPAAIQQMQMRGQMAPYGYGTPPVYYYPQGPQPYMYTPRPVYAQPVQYPAAPPTATQPAPAAPYAPIYDAGPVDAAPAVSVAAAPVRPPAARMEADFLLWWISGAPVGAPILTQGPFTTPSPGTTILPGNAVVYGNEDRNFNVAPGFRLKLEAWEPYDRQFGMSVSGFFLATQTNKTTIANSGADTDNSLNFAFNSLQPQVPGSTQNLLAGGPVAPGVTAAGTFTATATTSLWGSDLNTLFGAYRNQGFTLDLIAGFRYLDLNESLVMSSYRSDSDAGFQRSGTDSFTTRNQFYGGQIGGRAEYASGPFSASILATVALGANMQNISIDGSSFRTGPFAATPGGVSGFTFTQPSNIGQFSNTNFSAVPTVQIRTSYRLTQRIFASAGYEFTYWTDVVRPGNQIDNTINLSQSSAGPNGVGALSGASRPAVPFSTSDFWVHGILLALEFRY